MKHEGEPADSEVTSQVQLPSLVGRWRHCGQCMETLQLIRQLAPKTCSVTFFMFYLVSSPTWGHRCRTLV